nr:MAG TPA: hypothetical protein [Caudoviricetes sp.]
MKFTLIYRLDTAINGHYATVVYGYNAEKLKKFKCRLNMTDIG